MDVDSMIDATYSCKICSKQTSCINDMRDHIRDCHHAKKLLPGTYTSIQTDSLIPSRTIYGATQTCTVKEHEDVKLQRRSKRTRKPPRKFEENSFKHSLSDSPCEKDHPHQAKKLKSGKVEEPHLNNSSIKSSGIGRKKNFKTMKANTFVCTACNTVYKSKKSLQYHISREHNQEYKSCPECKCRFTNQDELETHIKCHYMDRFKCIMCDFSNVGWRQVKIHMEVHNDPSFHKCADCEQTFSSSHALACHRRFNHIGGTSLCDECGFAASSTYLLLEHRRKEHEQQLTCLYCEYRCDNETDMKKHVKTKHESGFQCKHCSSGASGNPVFPSKQALQYHVSATHNGVECYFCDKCNYVAKLKAHLEKHKMVHTGFKQYSCNVQDCNFRTKDHKNLMQHMTYKHRKPGELVCRACRFVTTVQNEWDVHQAMFHMQEHKCNLCSYTARSQAGVRKHKQAKHAKEGGARYHCSRCSYKSNFREALQKHMLTHSLRSKNFKCPFCPFEALDREVMMDHVTEQHPPKTCYICEKCNYTSRSNLLLTQHAITHKPIKPFQCTLCNYSTRTRKLLQNHVLKKHQHVDAGEVEESLTADAERNQHMLQPATTNSKSSPNFVALSDDVSKKVSRHRMSKLVQEEMRKISDQLPPIPIVANSTTNAQSSSDENVYTSVPLQFPTISPSQPTLATMVNCVPSESLISHPEQQEYVRSDTANPDLSVVFQQLPLYGLPPAVEPQPLVNDMNVVFDKVDDVLLPSLPSSSSSAPP